MTSIVAQLVESQLSYWEIVCSIPSCIIPKTLKMVLAALLLGAKKVELEIRTGQPSVSIT